MCDKCKPIDDKLVRYRFLRDAVLDPQILEGIKQLIHKLETQKKELHPGD
jgi:hypothetical protein